MKINLAENMLRFGAKNLTSASKQKLNQLAEQEQTKDLDTVTAKPNQIGQISGEFNDGALVAFGEDYVTLYNKSDRSKRVVIGPTTVTVNGATWNGALKYEEVFNTIANITRTLFGSVNKNSSEASVAGLKSLLGNAKTPANVQDIIRKLTSIESDIQGFNGNLRDFVYEKIPTNRQDRMNHTDSGSTGKPWYATGKENQWIWWAMGGSAQPKVDLSKKRATNGGDLQDPNPTPPVEPAPKPSSFN